MERKEIRFRKGYPRKHFENQAKFRPLKLFENTQDNELRLLCLKYMREDYHPVDLDKAYWAEKAIEDLFFENTTDEIWQGVFTWYIFEAKSEDILYRAIDFGIALAEKRDVSNFILKQIAGKITESYLPTLKFPASLKDFLCQTLNDFFRYYRPGSRVSGLRNVKFNEKDWAQIERCLKIIVHFKNYTFLWKVDELIQVLKEEIRKPINIDIFDLADKNLAPLKAAYRMLLNEWLKDLSTKIKDSEMLSHSNLPPESLMATFHELSRIKEDYAN